MEHRTIGWAIAAGMIGLLGGILIFAMEGENQKSELLRVQEELAYREASVASAEVTSKSLDDELANAEAKGKAMRDNKAALEAAQDRLSAVEKDLTAARKAWETGLADTASAVKNVRGKYWKLPPAEIKLTTGEVLQNAMVRNIEGTSAIVEHSDGVNKGSVDMLPAELREMLGINLKTTPPEFTLKEDKPAAPEASTTTPASAPAPVEVSDNMDAPPDDTTKEKKDDKKKENAEAIRKKIAELESGILNAQNDINTAQRLGDQYMSNYRRKVSGGVSNGKVMAEKEWAKIKDLNTRISTARKMIESLYSKLE